MTIGRAPRRWLANVNGCGVDIPVLLDGLPDIGQQRYCPIIVRGCGKEESRRVVPSRLQDYERTYRALAQELATELATVDFISPGSVGSRYTSCGKPGCRCQGDPPQRHGPYYQWSRARGGKTVTRRLTASQAELYRGWIANRRRIEQLITQMAQISADAAELLLRQAAPAKPPRSASRRPAQVGGQILIAKCGTSDPRDQARRKGELSSVLALRPQRRTPLKQSPVSART